MTDENRPSEPGITALRWQVVQHRPISSWVIAAFDLEEHAIAFALSLQAVADPTEVLTTREDPRLGALRNIPTPRDLFRPTQISELLAERDV